MHFKSAVSRNELSIHREQNVCGRAVKKNSMLKQHTCSEIYVGPTTSLILIDITSILETHLVTLSPCAVESCPTPGDNRGSTSPSVSNCDFQSHAVNGRSFYGVQIVQPSCSWPSSPSLSTHLPEHHIIFHSAFLSHHMSKVYERCLCHPRFQCPLRLHVFQHPYIGFSLHPRHSLHSPPTPHLKCINFFPFCFSHRPDGSRQGS